MKLCLLMLMPLVTGCVTTSGFTNRSQSMKFEGNEEVTVNVHIEAGAQATIPLGEEQ